MVLDNVVDTTSELGEELLILDAELVPLAVLEETPAWTSSSASNEYKLPPSLATVTRIVTGPGNWPTGTVPTRLSPVAIPTHGDAGSVLRIDKTISPAGSSR